MNAHNLPVSDLAQSGTSDQSIADYRLLQFGWSLADAVLFSGQILRDEPNTSCQLKFDDIISFRRSIGKSTDHPAQIILSKDCNFSTDHNLFSTGLRIIIFTSQQGRNNIMHSLSKQNKETVTVQILKENETILDILTRLKRDFNIRVKQRVLILVFGCLFWWKSDQSIHRSEGPK